MLPDLSDRMVESNTNAFLKLTPEKEKLNQYWYSDKTIEFLINQIKKHGHTIGIVSCPSIFFSLSSDLQEKSILFDFDPSFSTMHKNVKIFDYRNFENLLEYENKFDFIVIDPSSIDEEPWVKFADFTKLIAKKNDGEIKAKIILSSIDDNKDLLKKLLDVDIKEHQPIIPNLIYHYHFYSNYEDEELDKRD